MLTRKIFLLFLASLLIPLLILAYLFISGTNWNLIERAAIAAAAVLGLILLPAYFFSHYIRSQISAPIQAITGFVNRISEGKPDQKLAVNRKDEIGSLAEAIDDLNHRYNQVRFVQDTENIKLQREIHTCTEIARYTTKAKNLDDLAQKIAAEVVEQFEYGFAAIYTRDKSRNSLLQRACASAAHPSLNLEESTLPINGDSIETWVVKNNRLRIAPNTAEDPFYREIPELPGTRSELAIPISIDSDVIGVLDIRDERNDLFKWDEITILQTIVDQAAVAFQNYLTIETSRYDPKTSAYLFNAGHQILQAEKPELIYDQLFKTLKQLPFHSAFYTAHANEFRLEFTTRSGKNALSKEPGLALRISPAALHAAIPDRYPIDLSSPEQQGELLPPEMITLCQELEYKNLTLFPIFVENRLLGLLFLGSPGSEPISAHLVNALTKLVDIARQSIKTVLTIQSLQDRLDELQTLNTISQSIGTETDLKRLFEVIHQQVLHVMGNVNFSIAFYNEAEKNIEVPYMDDGSKIISIPPFPLGQGLTSIIVRTKQPLMIVEDTINRSRALGAILTDDNKPALSWLGVPILAEDTVLGVLIVQDLEQENRFDEEDMLFLRRMALQIAFAVRNARLMDDVEKRSERDRMLVRMSNRIWNATDRAEILAITAEDLGKTLNVERTTVEINLDQAILDQHEVGSGLAQSTLGG
jgi:GAF domain-containing protein/HAMP domain-containing protein